MKHHVVRVHSTVHTWRQMLSAETLAVLLLALVVFVTPAVASTRFTERSLFIYSNEANAVTTYKLSMRYVTPAPVGSVDMLFCMDPIPHHACVAPPGLDVSNAALSSQLGEAGFSILSQTANHIVLTRTPTIIAPNQMSSYEFTNITNPDETGEAFSIRLRSHTSIDATGPQIDWGSVRAQINEGIEIETQVPPILDFCLAEVVDSNCTISNNNYYTDMGQLSEDQTLTAQSQMIVGTNATAGFSIVAYGTPLAAGTNIIDALPAPTASIKGVNQFGINLVANSTPNVGSDPDGTWANAVASADYGTANLFKFVDGDEVAYSPDVSLSKRFTISYIVNASPDLRAGIYTTTVTFVASGRF